jgi:hypothetical protein
MGKILEGLGMGKVGKSFSHFEYFTALWNIHWAFGNLVAIWYILPPFWYIVSRKIWQPRLELDPNIQFLVWPNDIDIEEVKYQ